MMTVVLRTIPALALLALLAHAAAGAAPCVAPAPDAANTYDAAHTYDKLVRDYPAIRIASAALPSGVTKIADQTYVQYGTRCLKLDVYLPTAMRAGHGQPRRGAAGDAAFVLAVRSLAATGGRRHGRVSGRKNAAEAGGALAGLAARGCPPA